MIVLYVNPDASDEDVEHLMEPPLARIYKMPDLVGKAQLLPVIDQVVNPTCAAALTAYITWLFTTGTGCMAKPGSHLVTP